MKVTLRPVRFLIEAGFLVAVATVLALLSLSWIVIVVVMTAALLTAVLAEHYASEREERGAPPYPRRQAAPEPVVEASVPEPEPVAGAEPEVARSRGWLGRRPRPEAAEADASEPQIAAPAATAVLPPAAASSRPREWNVWELDRLAREGAGVDAARDEERALLLMYLRDFAGPDGTLPPSFDELVRESFGELIAAGGVR